MFFHAYSRWNEIEPYSQSTLITDFFSYGWLGVQLFFSVSGYVIYMSVVHSNNIFSFAVARYLRLAPAMIMASLIIYFTSFLIPERPMGYPNIIDFLPSLTFIDPGLLSAVSGLEIRSLDGAFWSLYVEVKFYTVVAIAYFLLNDRDLKSLVILYLIWLVLGAFKYLGVGDTLVENSYDLLSYFGVRYYGWFLLGIYAYKFNLSPNLFGVYRLSLLSIIAALTTKFGNIEASLAAFLVCWIFLLPLFFSWAQYLITHRFFLFFGYVSYPLYLIHQNIVTGLAISFYEVYPHLSSYLYPIPFIIIVSIASFFIAEFEPKIKSILKSFFPKSFLGHDLFRTKT